MLTPVSTWAVSKIALEVFEDWPRGTYGERVSDMSDNDGGTSWHLR